MCVRIVRNGTHTKQSFMKKGFENIERWLVMTVNWVPLPAISLFFFLLYCVQRWYASVRSWCHYGKSKKPSTYREQRIYQFTAFFISSPPMYNWVIPERLGLIWVYILSSFELNTPTGSAKIYSDTWFTIITCHIQSFNHQLCTSRADNSTFNLSGRRPVIFDDESEIYIYNQYNSFNIRQSV